MTVLMTHNQFAAEMTRWAIKHVPDIGKAVHAAVTEHVYKGIVMRTPVLTSRARHNWFPTMGAPSSVAVEATAGVARTGEPMTGQEKARIEEILQQIKSMPMGHSIAYLTNNQPYIQKLEDGSSPKSPPAAMVQGTIINTLDGLKVDIIAGKVV